MLARNAMSLDENLARLLHWKNEKKVSKKFLRHFPLIPMLQNFYAVEITVKDMR